MLLVPNNPKSLKMLLLTTGYGALDGDGGGYEEEEGWEGRGVRVGGKRSEGGREEE